MLLANWQRWRKRHDKQLHVYWRARSPNTRAQEPKVLVTTTGTERGWLFYSVLSVLSMLLCAGRGVLCACNGSTVAHRGGVQEGVRVYDLMRGVQCYVCMTLYGEKEWSAVNPCASRRRCFFVLFFFGQSRVVVSANSLSSLFLAAPTWRTLFSHSDSQALLENGVLTMIRGHNVFCNPPLIISAEEVRCCSLL